MSWKKILKQGIQNGVSAANDIKNNVQKLGNMAQGGAQQLVQNVNDFKSAATNAVNKYAPAVQNIMQNVQGGVGAAIDKGKELYGATQAGIDGAVQGVNNYYGETTPQQSPVAPTTPNQGVPGNTNDSNVNNQNGANTYSSQWTAQIDSLMDQIMNREKFSYDMNADAMYQQYKDMYTNQADMGMQNAMSQAAAMTGGYGSSYGQMVGQQAYAQQMQGLNNVMPELYAQALAQYTAEGDNLYNQYNLLANQEAQDYARYLDDRNFAYQIGRDDIADKRYEQEWVASEEQRAFDNAYQDKLFEYQQGRDTVSDAQWREQFEHSKEQDSISQDNWNKQFEYGKEQDAIANKQWQDSFDYNKSQDELVQQNWQQQFDYAKEQDEQSQANWQAEHDRAVANDSQAQENWEATMEYQQNRDEVSDTQWQAELDRYLANDATAKEQWQAEHDRAVANDAQAQENWQAQFDREGEWYDDAQEASSGTTTYEGEGDLNGQEVPKQIAGVQGLTTTNVGLFDENGYFKQAAVVSYDNEKGTIVYTIGGKEITVQSGTNPYTNSVNLDVKNGVFDNGYQPDNIGGHKLTEVEGQFAIVNGQRVPIYTTDDGKEWIYDAANNEYFNPEGEDKETPEKEEPKLNSYGAGAGGSRIDRVIKV